MDSRIRKRIQEVYAGLRPSEQKVADYFWKYEGKAGDLLIEQVAKKAKVSQPTVIRFVKALGYGGFKEFKYSLMQEEIKSESSGKEQESIELYGFQLSRQDSLDVIPGKVVTTSIQLLEETLRSIQIREFRRGVEAIVKAKSIVIYSVENSSGVAHDLLTKLTYLGLNCRSYGDSYLQSVSASNLDKGDLAVGISYSGYSRDTVEMIHLAKKAGASTLVITNFENSLITEYADILLCTSDRQFLYGNTIFSRVTQMALVDMLYAGVLNYDYDRLHKNLNKNSRIVSSRAYDKKEEIL